MLQHRVGADPCSAASECGLGHAEGRGSPANLVVTRGEGHRVTTTPCSCSLLSSLKPISINIAELAALLSQPLGIANAGHPGEHGASPARPCLLLGAPGATGSMPQGTA